MDPSDGAAVRERLLLDFGWRFHLGHADDPARDFGFGAGRGGNFQKTGGFLLASSPAFDDGDWKPVDLPHDWAIELPFQNDPELAGKGFYPLGRAYPETSVGWYRLDFELPAADAGKRISLEFDGVYREAMVVLNGFYVGRHSGGYDPFSLDVTDLAAPGGRNVLLVRVDATLSDGWFYEGAGIYRHVWLVKTAPVHVKQWGTFVRAEVRPDGAVVSIRTEVENQADATQEVRVVSTILAPAGEPVGRVAGEPQVIPEWRERTFEQQAVVRSPALWSLEERNLYRLVTEVEVGGEVVDRYETGFGIRSLSFDPDRGFFLNGKSVKVRGTCNHQDHAGLGVALPDAVQYYRVRCLQEMGCNAYRSSHNPPTPELLDACDELGMLVLDETRMMSSNPEGLAQFRNLVRRDRNHPSVFMWSMGNEEGKAATDVGLRILTSMKRVALEEDATRPVTVAPPPLGLSLGKGGLAVSDVMAYNYADPPAEEYHRANPTVPVIGAENVSAVGTRGIYVTDPEKGYVGSYDPYTTTGRASAEGWWRFVDARPWVAGGFVWTGFDYRGEPSPYQWPNVSSQYGVIDTCGFPKDTFYYYRAWWTDEPALHLFPHWDWPGLEGQEIAVWVHTNLQRVELFLNGQSLGAQEVKKDRHLAWNVRYAPGAIEARGYRDGKHEATARRETTGAPARLSLRVDRQAIAADGEDVAMCAVEVQDARGRVVPTADDAIAFRVFGPGKLIGVGNGDPTSHESDRGDTRRAFSGLCMAIVQAGRAAGTIVVEASSLGLAPARAEISATSAPPRPQVAPFEREVPVGPGVTGLWRASVLPTGRSPFGVVGDLVFSLEQAGERLAGTVEGGGGGFLGGPEIVEIEDGRVEGDRVSFKAGNASYTGALSGDQIELERAMQLRGLAVDSPAAPTGPRPVVGPPPDGSDPSFGPGFRRARGPQPLSLRRADR